MYDFLNCDITESYWHLALNPDWWNSDSGHCRSPPVHHPEADTEVLCGPAGLLNQATWPPDSKVGKEAVSQSEAII